MSNLIEDFKETILPETLIGSNYERIGIGGFTFYASVNESTSKTATITANPIEDGSTINDHIIKNPTVITIEGEVANLFIELKPNFNTVQEVFAPIGIIQDYLPERTQTQISKINGLLATVNDYYEAAQTAIDKGQQLYDFFTGKQSDTSYTSKFLEFFNQVHESRSVIDVECVDTIYSNMAIQSFTVVKPRTDVNTYTFSISLQKITKVETRLITLIANASGDATAQGANVTDKGTQQAKDVDESFASTVIGLLK